MAGGDCYSLLMEELIKKIKTLSILGGIIIAIVTILFLIFYPLFEKYSFLCLDPEICRKMDERLKVP